MEQTVREAPLAAADPQEEKGRRRPCEAPQQEQEQQQPRALTAELLAARNQPGHARGLAEVRLDGERLGSIPPQMLPALAEATHLHLQGNCFESTRGLSGLPALRYLSLAHNRVTEVAGLQQMDSLAVLDLSHNQIRTIDPTELPPSLQVLRLAGNPLVGDQAEVTAGLARVLPLLRQVDRVKIAPVLREPSPESLSGSDGVTAALVEAALAELEREDAGSMPPGAALFKQHSGGVPGDGLQSPIRVAPASRQGSSELETAADARAAQEVAARVREALPSLRQLVGVSIADDEDALDPSRRSQSTTAAGGASLRAFRRHQTEDVAPRYRATSLPAMGDAPRSLSAGAPAGAAPGPRYPLTQPPPDFAAKPAEFQALLVGAISLLVGARPPGAVHAPAPGASLVWQQVQQRRQQVLASLFAKRAPSATGGGPMKELQRADSVISRQGRRRTGSTINDEMLQGLHARDAPRAEGLSEAMHGPAPAPPGDQLAALSQDAAELSVAEGARMSLRCGVCKMLEAAQARRAREPSAEAAVCSELRQMKQMASMQSVLAMRDWHSSPHQQVLATLLGGHSRLGSITDRLASKLAVPPQPPTPPRPQGAAPREPAPVSIAPADRSGQQPLASPFGSPGPAVSNPQAAAVKLRPTSPFDNARNQEPEPAAAQRAFLVSRRSQESSSSSSSSSTEAAAAGLAGRRLSGQAGGAGPGQGLQRRLTTRMSQPAGRPPPSHADQESDPPADRQSARVIFGGIAEQLTRGRSGQVGGGDAAASPGRGRAPMSRAPSAKAGLGPARPKPNPLAGSGAPLSLGKTSPSSESEGSDRRAGVPPRPPLHMSRAPSQQLPHMSRAPSQQLPPPPQQQLPQPPQQGVTITHVTHSFKQQQEVEEELWTRFSGGAGAAARVVQAGASPGGGRRPEQHFTSPFSTFGGGGGGGLGAVSPFSQAPAAQPPPPLMQGPFHEAAAAPVQQELPPAASQPRPPAPSPFAAD